MEINKYSWNQTLKFSWGHIIAFVAIIYISYVMYMGDFYKNGGDFLSAAIKVGVIDILLLLTFIGAQIIKGTDKKFDRSIIIERLLICLSPIVFLFAMFSYNHFWSVFGQRQQIEENFNSSIEGAKQMFVSYDEYVENRIKTYKNNLDSILIAKANGNSELYDEAGFTGINDHIKKQNYIHTLDLQLRSQNVDNLKRVAINWIDEANQGASVWNAFLVGNVEQISEAINSWHKTLQSYSEAQIGNESIKGNMVLPFDENSNLLSSATIGITSLSEIYTQTTGLKIHTMWTGVIVFLMLLFPYFLQRRNTRAEGLYFLIPRVKDTSLKIKDILDSPLDVDEFSESTDYNKQSTDNDIFGGTF